MQHIAMGTWVTWTKMETKTTTTKLTACKNTNQDKIETIRRNLKTTQI